MQKTIQSFSFSLLLLLSCSVQAMHQTVGANGKVSEELTTISAESSTPNSAVKRPGTPQVPKRHTVQSPERDFALLALRVDAKDKSNDSQTVTLADVCQEEMKTELSLQEAIVDPIIKKVFKQNHSQVSFKEREQAICLMTLRELAKRAENEF